MMTSPPDLEALAPDAGHDFPLLGTRHVLCMFMSYATAMLNMSSPSACNINGRLASHLHKLTEPGASAALALAFNNLRRRRLLHALEGSHASQTLGLPAMERL